MSRDTCVKKPDVFSEGFRVEYDSKDAWIKIGLYPFR